MIATTTAGMRDVSNDSKSTGEHTCNDSNYSKKLRECEPIGVHRTA